MSKVRTIFSLMCLIVLMVIFSIEWSQNGEYNLFVLLMGLILSLAIVILFNAGVEIVRDFLKIRNYGTKRH